MNSVAHGRQADIQQAFQMPADIRGASRRRTLQLI
jgi:hypothetical protein